MIAEKVDHDVAIKLGVLEIRRLYKDMKANVFEKKSNFELLEYDCQYSIVFTLFQPIVHTVGKKSGCVSFFLKPPSIRSRRKNFERRSVANSKQ